MKKLLLLFSAVLALFMFSCREDGEWDNNGAEGQFGFTIERDQNFIEKSVGEANPFKFNVHTNYTFGSIPTTFKFTTGLNGVLTLGGQVLTPNQEYPLTSENNIFEYTANVQGNHVVKITVQNSKGVSKEETFTFPYGVSEFTHTYEGGTAPIAQGDVTPYLMKIVPGPGQPTTGYQIKYNTYSGQVQLNGVPVSLGTWYPLPNIDSFTTALSTNQAGQGKLTYTIKNATVSKDYEIQQNIIQRQITVESMNISATTVVPGAQMSLAGVVKKTPVTTNNTVQYKTWISAASNNNMGGIQSTNNVYTPYALGANGSFNINFNAVATGTYTYNIQFKDEYGNESDIKSFNVTVGTSLTFVGTPTGTVVFTKTSTGVSFSYHYAISQVRRTFTATANPQTITKVEYTLSYDFKINSSNTVQKSYTFSENVNFLNTLTYNNEPFTGQLTNTGSTASVSEAVNNPISNVKLKIKVTANDASFIETEVPVTFVIQ